MAADPTMSLRSFALSAVLGAVLGVPLPASGAPDVPREPEARVDPAPSVWGNIDKLTPPRPLFQPLIVTDYTAADLRGPVGQTLQRAPRDGVLVTIVDGNGGDLWLQAHAPHGRQQPVDFPIVVKNFRNVRVTGLWLRIHGDRTIRPNGSGKGQVLEFRDTSPHVGQQIFVEGLLAEGNGTDRVDLIASHNINYIPADGHNRRERYLGAMPQIVIQNSHFSGISSDDPATHADAWHMQGKHLVQRIDIENVYIQTKFQGLQMNQNTMQFCCDKASSIHAFPTQPVNLQPVVRVRNVVIAALGSKGLPLYLGSGYASNHEYGTRLHIPEWNEIGSGLHIARQRRAIAPPDYGIGTSDTGWMDGAPVSDGEGQPAYLFRYDRVDDLPSHPAASSLHVGPNYVSPWGP